MGGDERNGPTAPVAATKTGRTCFLPFTRCPDFRYEDKSREKTKSVSTFKYNSGDVMNRVEKITEKNSMQIHHKKKRRVVLHIAQRTNNTETKRVSNNKR